MTSNDNAPDQELLERYRRASDTQAAAPSDAVRAAILAEGRRAAELHARQVRGQPFDASRPAANDSRWKIPAFGTAGAALLAALLFAPRLWEGGAPTPSASQPPKAESLRASANTAEPLQEIVVTQAKRERATRENSKAAGAAPPRATALQPPADFAAPPEHQKAEALAQAAPERKSYQANLAPAAPSPAAPSPAAPSPAAPPALSGGLSMNADRASLARSARAPATLQSAAASGNAAQITLLLDQGAAIDARDERGRTPLMLAVMQSRLEVVRLLLDRGADPNLADNTGRTPLQQANQENSREIAALLERAGAH
jgi:ankyrin repeat protein